MIENQIEEIDDDNRLPGLSSVGMFRWFAGRLANILESERIDDRFPGLPLDLSPVCEPLALAQRHGDGCAPEQARALFERLSQP